ncbi:MAG TPA: DUF4071 domain-containing protein [Balneolaceae bacterium]|nr:DUF4071 domain-containing protein [Balneolaceae bacterium]
MKPYCFVLMPFGTKEGSDGRSIEFDEIYTQVYKPAIKKAKLEPIRADEEWAGGIIHKPMFERLMLCDYAIADLTTANPNVLYELGVRHGLRPFSTILTFVEGMRLPFDVKPIRGIPFKIDEKGLPTDTKEAINTICERLVKCREQIVDSPLFQLIEEMPRPEISHLKTDTFRDLVNYSTKIKKNLEEARLEGPDAVVKVEESISQETVIADFDPSVIVDLFLSYRAVKGWDKMIELVGKMSPELSSSILVKEQYGLALNRIGEHSKAEKVLKSIIEENGPSPETNGILGRVYKDLWKKSSGEGKDLIAQSYLEKAIETYRTGFEIDWRDAYPGVNAVTLMEVSKIDYPEMQKLFPVVKYSVEKRLNGPTPDYWDFATMLELYVISEEEKSALEILGKCLTEVREVWEPETTVNNINLLLDAKKAQGKDIKWIETIIEELENTAKSISS